MMVAVRMLVDVVPFRAGRVYLVPPERALMLVQCGMAVFVHGIVPGPTEYKADALEAGYRSSLRSDYHGGGKNA